ncbi:MAG: type II toxin-antitoxin system Phd/YefM family antitoxin [Patescibacteria group bacterium]
MKTINAKQARENFPDLLDSVYYGNESITIEKQGRPFVVIISPDDYKYYKSITKDRLFNTISEMQKLNKRYSEDEVYNDVKDEVSKLRKNE